MIAARVEAARSLRNVTARISNKIRVRYMARSRSEASKGLKK